MSAAKEIHYDAVFSLGELFDDLENVTKDHSLLWKHVDKIKTAINVFVANKYFTRPGLLEDCATLSVLGTEVRVYPNVFRKEIERHLLNNVIPML